MKQNFEDLKNETKYSNNDWTDDKTDFEEGDDDDEESSEEKNATYDPDIDEATDLDEIAEEVIDHCTDIWCLTTFKDEKSSEAYAKVIKTLAFARTQFIICNKFIKNVPSLRKFLLTDNVVETVIKCRKAMKAEKEKGSAVSEDFDICYKAVDKTVKLFKRAKRQLPKA